MDDFKDFYNYMLGYETGKKIRNIVEKALDSDPQHLTRSQLALLQAAIEQSSNPEFGSIVINKYQQLEEEN